MDRSCGWGSRPLPSANKGVSMEVINNEHLIPTNLDQLSNDGAGITLDDITPDDFEKYVRECKLNQDVVA